MLEHAISLARENPTDLNRMAAIIAKRREVLGIGLNSRKTHPLQYFFSKSHVKVSVHAEIAAIIDALKTNEAEDLIGSSIFVARVLKNGSRATAKPCEICQRAIKAYGIKAVYYTEYE